MSVLRGVEGERPTIGEEPTWGILGLCRGVLRPPWWCEGVENLDPGEFGDLYNFKSLENHNKLNFT